MEQVELIKKLETLEKQLTTLKSVVKNVHNTDAVYNTKDTMGYAQMIEATGGKTYYLSGMTPWNKEMKLMSNDINEQLGHTLDNLVDLLKSKDLSPQNLVSVRLYVAKPNYYDDWQQFLPIFKEKLGEKIESSMTMVGVTGLAEPEQLIEIEAIAVN